MEHPCHKCGAPVEDGVPFCKQCGAPQIRVTTASPSGEVLPAESASPQSWERDTATLNALPGAIQWSSARGAVILGGLLATASMAIPFPTFGLGLIAGGYLCVSLYRRRTRPLFITFGMGACLGAAAGAAGFVVFGLLTGLGTLVFVKDAEVRDRVVTMWQDWAARNPSIQIDQLLQFAKSPEQFVRVAAISLAIALPIFLLVCALGGVIAAAVLGKKPVR